MVHERALALPHQCRRELDHEEGRGSRGSDRDTSRRSFRLEMMQGCLVQQRKWDHESDLETGGHGMHDGRRRMMQGGNRECVHGQSVY
jgi:hypothetical protein